MTAPGRRALADLAAEAGTEVACAGNSPVWLDDPRSVWLVGEGAVDIFLVEVQDGEDRSAPRHLLRAGAGRLLPGVAPDKDDTTLSLRARGLPGTVLRRLDADRLAAADPADVAAQADLWIADLSGAISRYVAHLPRPDAIPVPGETLQEARGVLSVRHGAVWVSQPPPGASLFMDLVEWPDFAADGTGAIPLTPTSWLRLTEPARLSVRTSETLAEEGVLLSALAPFHAATFALERLNRRLFIVDQTNLARDRAASRQGGEHTARHRLFDLYGARNRREAGAEMPALAEALRIIGDRQRIEFRIPERSGEPAALDDILEISDVRARPVRLDPGDRWWLGDSNPMLAFRAEDGRPVALLPGILGRYREIDPASGRGAWLTAQRAGALKAEGWIFYRPLPEGRAGLSDLLRIASQGSAADLSRLVLAGLPVGLIALLPALALGFVANRIVEVGGPGEVYTATAVLAVLGLLGALLHILRGMASMRLGGRGASRIEAAFWDRMLRLPIGTLRRFPPGDLAMRGMTFEALREGAQGVVADGVVSAVFLLPAFFLVLFYDTSLGGVALALGVASLLVTVAFGLIQVMPHGRVIGTRRRVASGLFQIINGISKLRAASAEGLAFASWAQGYREQKRAELRLHAIKEHLRAFCAALPFLTAAVLVLATVLPDDRTIPAGDFLVIFAMSMAFQAAVARLGESFGMFAALLPALAQVRPLLAEVPESAARGEPVEALGGDILFDSVSFRYDPDGPRVLDNVTIRVRPGEFIAITGESGAGKSTLLRLALGLDRPAGGAVYYDGRDLERLNLKQLRRHIGSVTQTMQLHPQDVLDNIIGHHDGVTNAEVWQAARTACVDREITAMPMQMATPVGGVASILSGSESQRIKIAHALIRNARVLLLDEATNWLGKEEHAGVMQNLSRQTSTRIVITHRLSTLRLVDRIYVMRAGKVIQEGTFDELTETEGLFLDLVRRQMA